MNCDIFEHLCIQYICEVCYDTEFEHVRICTFVGAGNRFEPLCVQHMCEVL